MRIHFTASKAPLLLLAMCLVLGSLLFSPVRVSALTDAQKKDCQSQWGGKTFDLSNSNQKQKFKDFQNSKCSDSFCSSKLNDVKNTVTISCSSLSGGGAGSGNGCVDTSTAACSISDPALASGGCSGSSCTFINAYINPAIKLLSALVGVTAVIFIIFGAIQVSSSGGDPQKSANGKNHIRNALIGIVAYILLFVGLNWLIPGGII